MNLIITSLRAAPFVALAATPVSGEIYNAFGQTGIIDMPSARMQPDGETAWTFSRNEAIVGGVLTFQAAPGLEASISFLEHDDFLDQGDYSDSSLNLKFRLFEERGALPAVALGFNAISSNDAFTSEYLVASKTLLPGLVGTVGIGWGRYGEVGGGREVPTRDDGFTADHLFQGDPGVFGGVTWQTPLRGVTLLAEYSSDEYQFEAFEPESQFNFGLAYEPADGVQIGGYYKYGSEVGFSVTFHGNPARPYAPPGAEPAGPPVVRRGAEARDLGWAQSGARRDEVVAELSEALSEEDVGLQSVRLSGRTMEIYITNPARPQLAETIGRTARVATRVAPPAVEEFRITPVLGGFATSTVVVQRSDLEDLALLPEAGPESFERAALEGAPATLTEADFTRPPRTGFSWSIAPEIPINVPNDGETPEFEADLVAFGQYDFTRQTFIEGALSYRIAGDIAESDIPDEPTARSDLGAYDRDGIQLASLTANHLFQPGPELYGRVTAGYFERMYGGAGVELVWMPPESRVAFGADINYARKRDYDDMLGFLDRDVVTGFVSAYWDTGLSGLTTQIDVGRYLDEDWGATVRLSRGFTNGWNVSAYTTITEDTEDELNLGFRVTIPFAWASTEAARARTGVAIGDLTGDAGARLSVPNRVYPRIREASRQNLYDSWAGFWQ